MTPTTNNQQPTGITPESKLHSSASYTLLPGALYTDMQNHSLRQSWAAHMKVLRFYGNRDLRFEESEKPAPQAGEVLLKIIDAGLSQGTVAEYIEGPFIANSEPHPLTGVQMPLIPCQEFGGIIEEVGADADPTLVGQYAAALPAITCGECSACESGRDNLCQTLAYRGILGVDGGFREYATLPQEQVFLVDDPKVLNLIEPMLVATHAIGLMPRLDQADRILVLGAGCIGLCVAAILRDVHKKSVVLTDPLPNRLATANTIGFATKPLSDINSSDQTYPIVVDAAGKESNLPQQPIETAIDLCSPGGGIIGVGTYFINLEMTPAKFLFTEKQLIPSFAYTTADVQTLKDCISSIKVDFSPIFTRVPFDRLLEEGYYQAELDRDVFTRIVTSAFE